MSEIELFQHSSNIRLIAYSSPVRSPNLELLVLSLVKVAISDVVMASPAALLNAAAIAARRLGSGMSTTAPATISSNSDHSAPTLEGRNMRVNGDRVQRVDLYINPVSTAQARVGYEC